MSEIITLHPDPDIRVFQICEMTYWKFLMQNGQRKMTRTEWQIWDGKKRREEKQQYEFFLICSIDSLSIDFYRQCFTNTFCYNKGTNEVFKMFIQRSSDSLNKMNNSKKVETKNKYYGEIKEKLDNAYNDKIWNIRSKNKSRGRNFKGN